MFSQKTYKKFLALVCNFIHIGLIFYRQLEI